MFGATEPNIKFRAGSHKEHNLLKWSGWGWPGGHSLYALDIMLGLLGEKWTSAMVWLKYDFRTLIMSSEPGHLSKNMTLARASE
jgi:hypothetical protein